MKRLNEIRVPNVSTRAVAFDDMDDAELGSDVAVATMMRPAGKAEVAKATGSSTGHAGLFTVDLLGGWLKP